MPQFGRLLRRSLVLAAREQIRHPWRTILICQGILWAVALMVAPAAILQGSREAAVEQAHALGTDRIQIEAEPGSISPLIVEDLVELRNSLGDDLSGTMISGQGVRSAIVQGQNVVRGWIVTTDVEERSARSLELIAGRWFEAGADPPEVVLEEPLARRLLAVTEGPLTLDNLQLWIAPGRFNSWSAGIG
ncbi:MAG: ABC transporter permease, partial [Planctomycetota bacterium]